MPEAWTGELIGKMHNAGITRTELADELGYKKPYITMILNGKRKPPEARAKLEAAFEAVKQRKAEAKQRDTDCHSGKAASQ